MFVTFLWFNLLRLDPTKWSAHSKDLLAFAGNLFEMSHHFVESIFIKRVKVSDIFSMCLLWLKLHLHQLWKTKPRLAWLQNYNDWNVYYLKGRKLFAKEIAVEFNFAI